MYFPNLTETAFADTMMGLGMGITLATLALLAGVIRLLISLFPYKKGQEEKKEN